MPVAVWVCFFLFCAAASCSLHRFNSSRFLQDRTDVVDWEQLARVNQGTEELREPLGPKLAFAFRLGEQAWFRNSLELIIIVETALIGSLAVYHIRTERSQQEWRQSEHRWQKASQAAKLGLWSWDIAANRFWASHNACALIGHVPPEPTTFQQVRLAQHPDDRDAADQALQRALKGEAKYDAEFRVLLPDREPRWLAARGVVDFENGKPVCLRGAWLDLSEHRGLEMQAAQVRTELAHMGRVAMLGELSGSLAHEINQPLAAILSNAQAAQHLIEQDSTNTEEIREILLDIVEEDRRAAEIIRRMRSMLKKGAQEFHPLDINKLIQQVLALMRSDFIARNVAVVSQLASYLPLVRGDAIQVQQVLMNVLLNACEAIEHTPAPEREILLQTEADGPEEVRISVRDRGPGVAGSMLETIFEPFMSTKPNGLGMGLALCRSIITAHGGRIWAAKNEGSGLTVSFTLRANLGSKS